MKSFSFDDLVPSDDAKVIPAATVVIFRHGAPDQAPELLMVQRAKKMRFAGGAAVFPGGKIDPADNDLAARIAPDEDPLMISAKVAAVRETLEETGLLIAIAETVTGAQAAEARAMLLEGGALGPVLDHFGWHLALDRLVYFAHWCPPYDGAFDTRFFLIDLGTGAVDIKVDATENTRLFWASAAETLAQAEAEAISVIFPTRRNLERLALFGSFAEACAHIDEFPPYRLWATPETREDGRWLTIPGGHGYPVLEEPLESALRG